MLEKQEMPLASYTNFGLHAEANLSDGQRKAIMDWAKEQMKNLKETYPSDSLVMPKRGSELVEPETHLFDPFLGLEMKGFETCLQ